VHHAFFIGSARPGLKSGRNGSVCGTGDQPFWLGGICAHLDRTGMSGARFLPKGVASLPA
jgi:hypothetical protein